jgi:magnesium transporter
MTASQMHAPPDPDRPWLALVDRARAGDIDGLIALLDTLSSADAARQLAHLSEQEQLDVLTVLPPDEAAHILEQLTRAQAVELIEILEPTAAADILSELPYATEADILRDLDEDDAERLLAELPPDEAAEVRSLASYDDDVAGGLMTPVFLAIHPTNTVAEIIDRFRQDADAFRDHQVLYVYVVDTDERLIGVLRLRDLLLAQPDATASTMMIADPLSVDAQASMEVLIDLFDKHSFIGLPVVEEGRLVGVVRRTSVNEAVGDEAWEDHMKAAGIVSGEELRSMDLLPRAGRRLQWLSLNIGLNIIAASVIAMFQDTLSAVIALAVFLPIISDMSGCSGNQAVAVSMRELSLGVAQPRDALFVLGKELSVGLLNGVVLGILLGMAAWLWQGNPYLGLVAGGALAINTLVAVSIGGTVPLLLKGFDIDPALASGPVLTTVTDLCGFLLVLGLATLMLPLLV